MRLFTLVTVLVIGGAVASNFAAAKLLRGPYLQMGSHTNMVIRWRTDIPTASVVNYGTNELTLKAGSSGILTEHVVLLTGLTPYTRYNYSISTTNGVLASGADCYFVTAPVPGAQVPTRVWVLGDPGTRETAQKEVRDAYYTFTGRRRTDLWLMLGDNAYSTGTDKEYQGAIFDMYRPMLRQSVLWPSLGNHDAGSANSATQSGIYYDIFTLPTLGQAGGVMSGTEAYYSYNYANVHFIALDSSDTDRSPDGLMVNWLKRDLAANRHDWCLAYWHHSAYTKGSHDSDNDGDSGKRMREMREHVMPVLEAGGVDLILCGHTHVYERSYLLNPHYGKSDSFDSPLIRSELDGRVGGQGAYRKPRRGPIPNAGYVYVNAGSSGHATDPKKVNPMNYPAMYISLNVPGSMVLDFFGGRMDASFLDNKGRTLDYFTMIKGPEPRPLPPR
jgi:hypothetical protein